MLMGSAQILQWLPISHRIKAHPSFRCARPYPTCPSFSVLLSHLCPPPLVSYHPVTLALVPHTPTLPQGPSTLPGALFPPDAHQAHFLQVSAQMSLHQRGCP